MKLVKHCARVLVYFVLIIVVFHITWGVVQWGVNEIRRQETARPTDDGTIMTDVTVLDWEVVGVNYAWYPEKRVVDGRLLTVLLIGTSGKSKAQPIVAQLTVSKLHPQFAEYEHLPLKTKVHYIRGPENDAEGAYHEIRPYDFHGVRMKMGARPKSIT